MSCARFPQGLLAFSTVPLSPSLPSPCLSVFSFLSCAVSGVHACCPRGRGNGRDGRREGRRRQGRGPA